MSQPGAPFSDVALDSLLLSLDHQQQQQQQQQQLPSREEQENLFNSSALDQSFYSSSNSDVFDNLDYTFDNASLAQIDSSTASAISTPDFSTYSLGNAALAYPTPEPGSPRPYPLDMRQPPHGIATTHSSLLMSHPTHLRSNTTTPFPHSAQPYVRRRSLSQGDADRIAVANRISNPTFVRLQAPRARSTTPDDKRKGTPYSQQGRSASQGPGLRGRPMKQSATPYGRHGKPLVGGMFSTSIGTPLDDVTEVEFSGNTGSARGFGRSSHHVQEAAGSTNHPARESGPIIKRMMHPEDRSRSRQIIQIGAMAMRYSTNFSSNLPNIPSATHHERILKKLDDIEYHLSQENGYNADALRGCTMIREALAKNVEMEIVIKKSEEIGIDTLDVPSTVFGEMDCSFMDGCDDDNELSNLLMQDSDLAGQKGHGE